MFCLFDISTKWSLLTSRYYKKDGENLKWKIYSEITESVLPGLKYENTKWKWVVLQKVVPRNLFCSNSFNVLIPSSSTSLKEFMKDKIKR
jgi:hypothetical protein